MTRDADIPHGPMPLGYSFGGFLPQVGIHRRRGVFYQESSRWHLWLAVPFLAAGVIVSCLSLSLYRYRKQKAESGKQKWEGENLSANYANGRELEPRHSRPFA